MSTAPVKFQLRRGAAADWNTANPVLRLGEPGLETDTNRLKFGDGVKTWTQLPYVSMNGATGPQGPTGPTGPQGATGPVNVEFNNTYLLNPPPAPIGLTIDSTSNSQYVNIYWQYPTQINVGINEAWLPYIIGLGAQLEGVTYNGLSNQTVVLPTTNANFVNLRNNGTNPILLLQLSPFGSGTSGPTNITIGSTTYVGFIIRDSGFAGLFGLAVHGPISYPGIQVALT